MDTHIISLLVEDKPGVMNRISGMFVRRGFNIQTVAVGATEKPGISRITLLAEGDDRTMEQITKQLNKLVEVIKVSELRTEDSTVRELCLIKVHVRDHNARNEIVTYTEIFRGNIVDVSSDSLCVEVVGDKDKIDAFVTLMTQLGIKEMARTGVVALQRGLK
jgi:acetolactate synthase-1/3 small subunit